MSIRQSRRACLIVSIVVLCVAWAGTAVADSLIIQDHFNGTSLAGHRPEMNVPNAAWSVTGSGATLWNQRAWAAGADWAGILATIDAGVADGTVAIDWTPNGEMPYGAIVARATDAANYLIAYYWSGALYLYRIASTGNVLLGSTSIDDPSAGTHRLTLRLLGTSIQVWYDRVFKLSAIDAFNITATRHGFRWLSYYNWQSTYSNFEVDGTYVPTAASVTVAPTSTEVPLFQSIALTATAYDDTHHVIPNMNFSWNTSNAIAVTVTPTTSNTATATAVGAGSATITAIPMQGAPSTAMVSVNTGPVMIFDTSAGANGTSLGVHAAEVNVPGGPWSTSGTGVLLAGNRAAAGGTDWNPITASVDAGIADGTIEVDWTPGGSDDSAATIVARMTNASNYLQAHYWRGALWLYRVADERYTLLSRAPIADAGVTTHHLAMKLAGSAIEVWWDGVQQIVANDGHNTAATRHGFRWYSWWDSQSTYDRFEVSALPAIASVTIMPSNVTIPMNGGRMFTAHAFDVGGAPIPGVSFAWQSSNPNVLSTRVASATTTAGVAESVGSATLTAIAFGGGVQQSVSVTITAPPPPPPSAPTCMGGIFPGGATWPADGGIGQLTISATSNCEWTVVVNASWITALQTTGAGNGVLAYAIDRNETGASRSGSMTIGSATFMIEQNTTFVGSSVSGSSPAPAGSVPNSSPPCNVTISVEPWEILFGAFGATGTLSVEAASDCRTSIVPLANWVVLERTEGSGNWTTTAFVQPNQGAELRHTLLDVGTLEGFTIPIKQGAAGSSAIHPYQRSIRVAGEVREPVPSGPPGYGGDPYVPHEPKATPLDPVGGGGEPAEPVNRQFESVSPCSISAQAMIATIKTGFSGFGNFSGTFGPGGTPLAHAVATFGNVPVTLGAVVPVHANILPPIPISGPPQLVKIDVTVTVTQVTSTSFTFATNPGHVLHPATITFSASDTASGLYFNIHVVGQFANILSNLLFVAGGEDLEGKLWNHFLSQVRATCQQ